MKVRGLIEATRRLIPNYFENTCAQRLTAGAGSCYDGVENIEQLEEMLMNATWTEVHHPAVSEGCRCYVTKDIPGGRFGLVEIKTLPEDTVLLADDRKNTGKVSLTVSGHRGASVEETYLITGPEQGEEVIYTFHPGEPVRESKIQTEDLPHGTPVSKEKALSMGFDLAKVV